jgi:hypothetical protein
VPLPIERAPEFGVLFQALRLRENLVRHYGGEPRMPIMEESSEAIEVGECDRRPFQLH